jgi:hypothetical protein
VNEATLHHVLDRALALRQRRAAAGDKQKRPADVRICVLEGGHVKPGYILQRIEDQFHEAQLAGSGITRVMVDSIPHWDLTCPYVHEDDTFGDTLIELLRRHRVTTLITCGQRGPQSESVLHRAVLDNADCLIQFEPVEFKGTSHVMVRVSHTRDMKHRREYFELQSDANTLELKTASTLLRVEPGGRVSPVKVILFLQAESAAHEEYNRSLLTLVRSVLSRDAEIQHDSPANVIGALGLATSSAIDELQVVQLQEFQVPPARARGDGTWRVFKGSRANTPPRDTVLTRLRERVERGSGLLAVPFYVNVGLLAHHRSIDPRCLGSWPALARAGAAWEGDSPDAIFFDCPRDDESYNCLFFEILHSLAGPPPDDTGPRPAGCALEAWLTSDAAVEAMLLMHRLCSRAVRNGGGDAHPREREAVVGPGARVWRHWYTTLNAMMSGMKPEDRADIVVRALPGGVSVAGDCFLAIPEHSAASDVGLNLIQLFTRQEAELDRVRRGVGLPTRASFYPNDGLPVSVSPYFTIDPTALNTAVTGALGRSAFGCYQAASGLLASHLRSVVASRVSLEAELRQHIRSSVPQLAQRLGFIGQGSCLRCNPPGRRRSRADVDA